MVKCQICEGNTFRNQTWPVSLCSTASGPSWLPFKSCFKDLIACASRQFCKKSTSKTISKYLKDNTQPPTYSNKTISNLPHKRRNKEQLDYLPRCFMPFSRLCTLASMGSTHRRSGSEVWGSAKLVEWS